MWSIGTVNECSNPDVGYTVRHCDALQVNTIIERHVSDTCDAGTHCEVNEAVTILKGRSADTCDAIKDFNARQVSYS